MPSGNLAVRNLSHLVELDEYPLPDLWHGVGEEPREGVELLERVLVPHALLLANLQDGVAGRQPEPGALSGAEWRGK